MNSGTLQTAIQKALDYQELEFAVKKNVSYKGVVSKIRTRVYRHSLLPSRRTDSHSLLAPRSTKAATACQACRGRLWKGSYLIHECAPPPQISGSEFDDLPGL